MHSALVSTASFMRGEGHSGNRRFPETLKNSLLTRVRRRIINAWRFKQLRLYVRKSKVTRHLSLIRTVHSSLINDRRILGED